MNTHTKQTGKTTWLCVQEDCDGTHHVYVNAANVPALDAS